jgi:hypothetical protein
LSDVLSPTLFSLYYDDSVGEACEVAAEEASAVTVQIFPPSTSFTIQLFHGFIYFSRRFYHVFLRFTVLSLEKSSFQNCGWSLYILGVTFAIYVDSCRLNCFSWIQFWYTVNRSTISVSMQFRMCAWILRELHWSTSRGACFGVPPLTNTWGETCIGSST